ncbi:5358_t:CDS:2, partial [Scutellospora calospora]
FRSRTTSNNSSGNTSPSLGPTTNTKAVDKMAIDEPEQSGEQLYCICRSSDGQSFMIECDNCDEWFHGACVKISSEESLMVDKFYCPNCTGFKTSWKAEKCKYQPCKKPARFIKSKFCSIKCGMDYSRILLEKEERAAKMKALLNKKNKDNKKGPVKRNVTNRTGQLEDGEKLKRIANKEAKIKKELEEIETLNNVAGRSTEKVQSESDQVDSDGSAQDVPCEFEKQSESDGPIRNAPICGYSPRLDWVIDKDDLKYVGEEICTVQKARCKKHRNWQSRKNMQIELAKANKNKHLSELAEKKKLTKARMRKRNDMEEAIINETIDHMARLQFLTSLTRAQTNYALPPPNIQGIPQEQSNNSYPNTEYARLLAYSLYFYEAERSGKLPANNRVSWRYDSALSDGQDVGLDLMIAWGALEWGNGYRLANQTQYLRDMIKWGTDWLINASSNTNNTGNQYLYVMIGSLDSDLNYWGPDTNIPTPRPSINVSSSAHGTDVSGETAAAMAASSLVFLNQFNDSAYANTLLTYAKNLYSFAETTPFTVYQNSAPQVKVAYNSSNYADELVWGALWLYRATNDTSYLDKAVNYFNTNSLSGLQKVFNWDEKSGACYVLFAQLFQQSGKDASMWKSEAERYLDNVVRQSGSCSLTNGGLLWCDGDSNAAPLNPSLGAALLCLVYAPFATSPDKTKRYMKFALSQIDYILGKNPINTPYVVGVHPNSPQNPHHAGAHGGTDVSNLNNPPQTQHVLYGAIVGGPNKNDQFSDSRADYVETE